MNNASPEKPVCFLQAFAPAEGLAGSRWLGKGGIWWMVCKEGWVPHITRAAAAHVTEIKSLSPLATGSWCLATDEPGGSVGSVRWPQGETLEMTRGRGECLLGQLCCTNSLTNRVNHCCLRPGGVETPHLPHHPHVWLHLNRTKAARNCSGTPEAGQMSASFQLRWNWCKSEEKEKHYNRIQPFVRFWVCVCHCFVV